MEYKIKYTINNLYDIYLNISNVNVIFPQKRKKVKQVLFSWVIVATMFLDELYKQRIKCHYRIEYVTNLVFNI